MRGERDGPRVRLQPFYRELCSERNTLPTEELAARKRL